MHIANVKVSGDGAVKILDSEWSVSPQHGFTTRNLTIEHLDNTVVARPG